MIEMQFLSHDGESVLYEPTGDNFDVQPLGYPQLVEGISSESPSFEIIIQNVTVRTNSIGLEPGQQVHVKSSFKHRGRVEIFGLVEGGWRPLPWAHKHVAWLDSNIVIAISKAVSQGVRLPWVKDGQGLGQDVGRVSSVLYALEGALQRKQSYAEMSEALDKGTETLQAVLTGCSVDHLAEPSRRAMYKELERIHEGSIRGEELLKFAAPLITQPVSKKKWHHVEANLIAKARETKASPLVLLALLSCLYDNAPSRPNHKAATPGRSVLKPGKLGDPVARYNALSDLAFLELLLGSLAAVPEYKPVFYTRDVGLAAFWAALSPHNPHLLPGGSLGTVAPRWTLNATTELFPALSESELLALAVRLEPST